MSLQLRRLALTVAPFVLGACIATHTPDPSLEVDASIASVTLADDCGSAGPPDGRAEPGFIAGDCAEDSPNCGFCRQTGMQLSIEAAAEGASVPFEVVAIRLYDMETGALSDTLDPRAAQIFVDGAYGAWDEMIHPGDSLNVSYDSSSPDWTAIGGGNSWETHGMRFRVEMDVRIDGVDRTLDFAPASREAEIVT